MSTAVEFQIRLSTGRLIALPNGARISTYELSGGWGERSGANSAEVCEDPHNPKELRLRNLTAQRWIAIMPDGARQEIDFGSGLRLKTGAQINFGATYGEIVDASAPAQAPWQRGAGAVVPTWGNFVARHWRGDLSLPMSFWINGVLFGLVWRLSPYPFTFSGTNYRPPWSILGMMFLGIAGAILTLWTVVGIWRSSESYDGRAAWRVLARVGAVLMAIATLAQFAVAVRLL